MKNVINILIFNLLFFSVGCGTLYNLSESKIEREKRANGVDPLHTYSCGPIAIRKAHDALGGNVFSSSISKEILDHGNWARSLLSVFTHKAREITMPSEIIRYFESRGFQIKKIKNFKQLKETDVSIILIKKKNTIYYHWVCFPVDSDIITYWGDLTLVKIIFLIKPN